MTIRVVVADDQPLMVSAFAALIDAQPDLTVVGTAANGREAVEVCRHGEVDVVVMDVRMPELDGVEATRLITRSPTGQRVRVPRVLVLTTFDTGSAVLSAVRAGAAGFLLKDVDPHDLLDAIRTVHGGAAVFAPPAARHLAEAYRAGQTLTAEQRCARDQLERLTDREREVLAEIADGHTNPEIAARLHIAETTVKTHVSNLLLKLDCRDRVALVLIAVTAGFGPLGH